MLQTSHQSPGGREGHMTGRQRESNPQPADRRKRERLPRPLGHLAPSVVRLGARMMERAHASMKTIFFVNILNFTLDFSKNSRGKTHNLTLRVAGFFAQRELLQSKEYNGNINACPRTVDCRFFAPSEFLQR